MRLHLGLAILGTGLFGAGALVRCSSGQTPVPVTAVDAGDEDVDQRPPTPTDWDRSVVRPDDSAAVQMRASCMFKRGALPAETLGTSTPVDKDIPIQNIVVLMMENHSFDSYFGHLNKYANRTDIESAPENSSNPAKTGPSVDAGTDASDDSGTSDGAASPSSFPYTHSPHLCNLDTNHEWAGTHLEYDNGLMDGFAEANQDFDLGGLTGAADRSLGTAGRAMYYYDERDIAFYYQLASTFAIADHYHCGLLGPTFPNRMYLYAATSYGNVNQDFPDLSAYPFPENDATVLDELEKRHVDWFLYSDGVVTAETVYGPLLYQRWPYRDVHGNISKFMAAAAAGTLPAVSFVDPNTIAEGPGGNDEHPPAQIQIGEQFASTIINAVMTSPQWAHTALFLTWDEHGGYYDHLPPPAACVPDDIKPAISPGDTTQGGFDRYGVRVPLIVVSPYAKKSYVGHSTYDHTSITRFIETKFKIPALTGRDANADPLMDMFDFSAPTFATPPALTAPTVDATEAAFCKSNYLGN